MVVMDWLLNSLVLDDSWATIGELEATYNKLRAGMDTIVGWAEHGLGNYWQSQI